MQKNMQKYSLPMRVLHWLMTLIIITLLAVGLWMTSMPNSPEKFEIYAMHKSFGIIALILIITRLTVRLKSQVPALPSEINKFDTKLSDIVIVLLYLCMVMQPLSGYLMSDFGGYKVAFFSINIPLLFAKNSQVASIFKQMHTVIGYSILALILLHVAGSIKHLLIEKVNLFRRMW